jgi:hypothetical protein
MQIKITLASANLHTKECVYVESPAMSIIDSVATLVFTPRENPLDAQREKKWAEDRLAASSQYATEETTIMVARWMDKDSVFEAERTKAFAAATEIEVKLHTPCKGLMVNNAVIEPQYRCWTALVPVISEICRYLFPHFNPKKSSFILYFADQHEYSCKKTLIMNDNNLHAKLIWKP